MLAVILNRWTYDGKEFAPRDLVDIEPGLLDHIFQVSVAQEVTSENVQKLFAALTSGQDLNQEISPEVQEKIQLRQDPERYHFFLEMRVSLDDEKRMFEFSVCKDLSMQKISPPQQANPEG